MVKDYLHVTDELLDIGTGGGERIIEFAPFARRLLGVDPDPVMIAHAQELAAESGVTNVTFSVGTECDIGAKFDVVVNRHAPFDVDVLRACLRPGGYFVTQQVGERNMTSIKIAFGANLGVPPPISKEVFSRQGLVVERFNHYDVPYVVEDIESLIFWLQSLDVAHSDFGGFAAQRDTAAINRLLATSLTPRGVVTNEHRYLLIARAL